MHTGSCQADLWPCRPQGGSDSFPGLWCSAPARAQGKAHGDALHPHVPTHRSTQARTQQAPVHRSHWAPGLSQIPQGTVPRANHRSQPCSGQPPSPAPPAQALTGSPLGPFSPGAPLRPASPCQDSSWEGRETEVRPQEARLAPATSPACRAPTFSPSSPGTPSRPSLPGMPWGQGTASGLPFLYTWEVLWSKDWGGHVATCATLTDHPWEKHRLAAPARHSARDAWALQSYPHPSCS